MVASHPKLTICVMRHYMACFLVHHFALSKWKWNTYGLVCMFFTIFSIRYFGHGTCTCCLSHTVANNYTLKLKLIFY
ncbi:hypothetical protein BpHYR1_032793 [Brachionus plicatilis]|uniref:Uncharacterized protein n=1 Tax=Brachionus plicatilis TaxID=10195 RepID=A0A3M7ST81_BRAPC|nr:hypothetical protein BpHYR1_032793 [Brachionus plicatilis]